MSAFIQLGLIAGAAVGAVLIMMEYAVLIIAAAAIVAIARGYFIYRQVQAHQSIAAAGERMRAEQDRRADAALAEKRRHQLAVAAASAPQVNITNTIDPAALLAAAFRADAWQPQPVRVVRREVEQ